MSSDKHRCRAITKLTFSWRCTIASFVFVFFYNPSLLPGAPLRSTDTQRMHFCLLRPDEYLDTSHICEQANILP